MRPELGSGARSRWAAAGGQWGAGRCLGHACGVHSGTDSFVQSIALMQLQR